MKRVKISIVEIFFILLVLFAFSCGDDGPGKSGSNSEAINQDNCYKLADEFDNCVYEKCNAVEYQCAFCNCMKIDGVGCRYSAHKGLKNCSEEENKNAEYLLGTVNCASYLKDFSELCPPPETNVCNKLGGYCRDGYYNDGYCIYGEDNQLLCIKSCNNIGSTGECYSGDSACYPAMDEKAVCLTCGNLKKYDKCEYLNDCECGKVCGGSDDNNFYCFEVCKSNSDCDSNETCVDTGLGYKVCSEN